MKTTQKVFVTIGLSFLVFGGMSCCKESINEATVYGTLGKLATPTSQGGTHFIGDTSNVGGYTSFISHNSDLNLDKYVGKTVSALGNYVGQRNNGTTPDLMGVVVIHVY